MCLKLKYEYNEDKSKVIVTGSLTTNPTMMDSDGDGLYDNSARMAYDGITVAAPKDPEPLVYLMSSHCNTPTFLRREITLARP